MAVEVKICGITTLDDALMATELGAGYLGFNFYPNSPRYINPLAAAEIIAKLPDSVVSVGLFVNATRERIEQVLRDCRLGMLQLHGDESSEFCRECEPLGLPVMKALRIREPADLRRMDGYPGEIVLLDAFREDAYGGTGHRFDWSWLKDASGKLKIFLAGGIKPENVNEALAVGTWGLDVCSGVETSPGVKDVEKMRTLFEAIRAYGC